MSSDVPVALLRDLVEAERARFGVAGLAVVVVRDREVLLAEGFGSRQLEPDEPVTPSTLFAIASDTKAFTAALCATLVDEGRLAWDAPVRDVLPWFRLHDPHATELVSLRDLLSHRTGLPRHDALDHRGGPKLDPEELVRRLRHLQPSAQLRQTWQYNNLCFSTAGFLAGHVAGSGYHQAVRDRLLDPLGMQRSCFGPAAAEAAGDHAVPYDDRSGRNEPVTRVGEGSVGPPGGLWSSAEEMAHWVLARLGVPLADGRMLLSAQVLAQLHAPAMVKPSGPLELPERPSLGYGLAADVYSYRGHRMVRHGGNLHGFSSDVVLLPDEGHAVVVLSNANGSAVRDALPMVLLDRLLDLPPLPWGERLQAMWGAVRGGVRAAAAAQAAAPPGAPPTRPLTEFAGRYHHPAYETFEVREVGGTLVPGWHDLAGISLRHRDHDTWDLLLGGHYSDLPMPVVFRAGQGGIDAVTIGLEPAVEPVVFMREPARLTAAQRDCLVGSYRMGPMTLTVSADPEGHLLAQVAGGAPARLHARDARSFEIPGQALARLVFDGEPDRPAPRVVLHPMGVFERGAEQEGRS